MELAAILIWKLWTVYARMFAVTAILSYVIKIRRLFKSTKWRHFQNVKFEALSARQVKFHNLLDPHNQEYSLHQKNLLDKFY